MGVLEEAQGQGRKGGSCGAYLRSSGGERSSIVLSQVAGVCLYGRF